MREAAVPNDSWKGRYQLPKRTVYFQKSSREGALPERTFSTPPKIFGSLEQKLCVEL